MVLYLWFAENQHYKFGKKSLLLSCLRFTVSGRSLQLGCWARCSQHTAIAWGNMEAGNLCKRRKGSRCRPALSLMSMPYTSWLNSTSPRSLQLQLVSPLTVTKHLLGAMCVTTDISHKHHAQVFLVGMFSGSLHRQLTMLYAEKGILLINSKQTPLSHFDQLLKCLYRHLCKQIGNDFRAAKRRLTLGFSLISLPYQFEN